MKTFIIEREIPGAAGPSEAELAGIAGASWHAMRSTRTSPGCGVGNSTAPWRRRSRRAAAGARRWRPIGSQREVVAARRSEGSGRALADAERRLAGICDLQGDRERALAARRVAAEAYAANGLPGEAAAERLVAAGYLRAAGSHSEAVRLARLAGEEAGRAHRAARKLGAAPLAAEAADEVRRLGEFDRASAGAASRRPARELRAVAGASSR